MKKRVEELYRRAKRFDEGELYQSEEYALLVKEENELRENISIRLGRSGSLILEEYAAILGDKAELECRHFFEQGYSLGRSEKSGKAE